MTALVSLVAGAYAWQTGPARRLKLWADVPAASRPACYVFEGGNERRVYDQQLVTPKRTIDVRIFIYIDAKDPNVIGSTMLNNILDAIDAAFAAARSPITGLISLGGAVFSCRIEGDVLKDPGDIDGDGMLIVPVRLVLP